MGAGQGSGFSQMAGGTGRGGGSVRLRVNERDLWKGLERPSPGVHCTSALCSSAMLCTWKIQSLSWVMHN